MRIIALTAALAVLFNGSLAAPGRASVGACAIFVAPDGVDTPISGISTQTPCATIQFGITRAIQEQARCVYVRAGVYAESITLPSGISVVGGFDVTWTSAPYSVPGHATQIIGAANGIGGQFVTVEAANTTPAAVLENVVVAARDASGYESDGRTGKSTYAIHAVGGNVVVRDCRIVGGIGAAGAAGSNGADAADVMRTDEMNGGMGGPGLEINACDGSTRGAAGPPGLAPACAGATSNGGAGGRGGTMDTSCPFSLNARPGEPGLNAPISSSPLGIGGPGGPPCGDGTNGNAGVIVNGTAGVGGNAQIDASSGYFLASAGSAGTVGSAGGGGGGGGGEGGCDDGIDSYGSGGGGGGAGGCAALGAGGGGGAGGGSYAIALVQAHLDLANSEILRGNGGAGGAGGSGGQGQSGGAPGPGNSSNGSPLLHSGNGGAGGHGGHGGGGGGGAGGPSVGIARCSNTTAVIAAVTYLGGNPGAGGPGGVSAPNGPGLEDDGNDGTAGIAGVSADALATFACPAPATAQLAYSPCAINDCLMIGVPGESAPASLAFAGLVPNPTLGGGSFTFALPRTGRVRLALFDHAGRLLRVVVDAEREAGVQTAAWDGRDSAGRKLASGVYLARLDFGAEKRVSSVIVVR